MITINSAFLTSIGIVDITNTDVDSQYQWHFELVMSNSVTIYNRYDFFKNSPVDGVYYNNQLDWYRAIGILYGENIYDQYSFFQNVSFDGITPVGNQYNYYNGIGDISPGPPVPPVPLSSFTTSTQSTIIGETITFTDTSTESPNGWAWDFGDGTTSSLQNPTHIYSSIGSFTVGLTASNGDGDGSLATKTINVTGIPVTTSFTYSPTSPLIGETITFTDTSTETPTSWEWDFGDGNTSSLQNPTHSYSSSGSFTVGLTASNEFGGDNDTESISVAEAPSGGSVVLNGSSQYLNSSSSVTIQYNHSYGGWFKLNSGGSNAYLMTIGWDGSDGSTWLQQNNIGNIQACFRDDTIMIRTDYYTAPLSTWVHYVVVLNGSGEFGKIYINGVFYSNSKSDDYDYNVTLTMASKTSPVTIGGSSFGWHYNGAASRCFRYDKSLTAGEISDLYNSGDSLGYGDLSGSLLTDLDSWWELSEDGSDSHGSNDFTLYGSPVFSSDFPGS